MNPMCNACRENPATNDRLDEGQVPLCAQCRNELREIHAGALDRPSTKDSQEHSQPTVTSPSRQRFDE